MADKDITIGIKATGADTAAAEIHKVETATEELARAQRQAAYDAGKAGGMGGQLDPGVSLRSRDMEAANAAATRSFAELTEKVRVSEIAYYNLDAEIGKTTQRTETFTAGATKMQGPTRNASQSLLLFSQGFEDAQYGIRGVLNNIPGLIVALGGTAGLAGGLSIAAVGFSMLYEWLGKTEEKAPEVAGKVREIATAMGEMEGKRFEKVSAGIDAVFEAADSLKGKFEETRKSEGDFALAALDNAAKIKLAEDNIATALGLQLDKRRELRGQDEADAAKRTEIAGQAVEVENQRLVKMQEAAEKDAARLTAAGQQLEVEKGKLQALREQLVEMRQQEVALKNLAKEYIPGRDSISVFTDKVPALRRPTAAAKEAQKSLSNFDYGAQIQGMEERMKTLDDAIQSLTKSIPKMENQLNAAKAGLEDVQNSVAINITKIEETLAADTLVAKSETLVETGKQFATDIKDALGKVEAGTVQSQQTKDALLVAASDGKIISTEQADVARNFQTLMGQLQSGQATFSGNMRELISLQQEIMKSRMQDAILISQLKAQTAQQQQQINQLYSRGR